MAATVMLFARMVPDWNSLDSVRHAHSVFELAALTLFALLVLFDVLSHLSEDPAKAKLLEKIGLCFFAFAVFAEILAYPYGQRNDTLSENIIGSLDQKAEKAKDAAGTALEKSDKANWTADAANGSAETAQRKASDAEKLAAGARNEADSFEKDIVAAKLAASRAEEKLADRTLTDEQQISIGKELTVFQGQEYDVVPYWDSKESLGLANCIHRALQLAHWKYIPPPLTGIALMGGKVGVQVWTHPHANEKTREAGAKLVELSTGKELLLKLKPPARVKKKRTTSLGYKLGRSADLSPAPRAKPFALPVAVRPVYLTCGCIYRSPRAGRSASPAFQRRGLKGFKASS